MSGNNEIKIETQGFPEIIHNRYGMYIGSNVNPTVILRELVDNCVDELNNGYGDTIIVDHHDESFSVVDNARGVPVYLKEKSSTPARDVVIGKDTLVPDRFYTDFETIKVLGRDINKSQEGLILSELPTHLVIHDIYASLHSGSKFTDDASGAFSIGMNGVGSSCTNALSSVFTVAVNLSKKDLSTTSTEVQEKAKSKKKPVYVMRYERGYFISDDVIEFDEVSNHLCSKPSSIPEDFGTIATAIPDADFWDFTKCDYETTSLSIAMMELPKGTTILVNGEQVGPYDIRQAMSSTQFFHDKTHSVEFELTNDKVRTKWKAIFGFSQDDFAFNYRGSANTLVTNEGVHITSITNGIGDALSTYVNGLTRSDVKYGLRLFSLVYSTQTVFNSQTKEHLSKINGLPPREIAEKCNEAALKVMKKDPEYFNAVGARIIQYKKEVGKLSQKQFIESQIVRGNDSKKSRGLGAHVYDCSCRDRTKAELFVVEGDSAGGTLLQTRNSATQAVLPLRGRPLNSTKVELEDVLENKEMKSLINVMGCGIHPFVDLEQSRYGKIIIAADRDSDGAVIASSLLGTFATYLPEMIDAGMIYVAVGPLYMQDGEFVYEEKDLNRKKKFERFKGLGSMDPVELHQTVTNHETRNLVKVTPELIKEAISLIKFRAPKKKLMLDLGYIQ